MRRLTAASLFVTNRPHKYELYMLSPLSVCRFVKTKTLTLSEPFIGPAFHRLDRRMQQMKLTSEPVL